MAILTQFIFRLSFGLALGMAVTDPRQVTSGYYRNHLYVLLGLGVLATMVAVTAPERFALAPPLAAAIVAYIGSLAWLFERRVAGRVALVLVAVLTLWGAWAASPALAPSQTAWIHWLDPITSGLVLGLTMAAMFLGHWYLNSPTMAIAPLVKLVTLMGMAIGLRGVFAAAALALGLSGQSLSSAEWLFVSLRWLSGIAGALALTWMARKTLEIPNTQSATGILYVAVIATFLGELTSLLLVESGIPG